MTITCEPKPPTMQPYMLPTVQNIPQGLSAESLLAATGWFFLVDVFKVLDPDGDSQYKLAFKQMEKLSAKGHNLRHLMGRVKLGGRVAIRMERFAKWYRENPLFHLNDISATQRYEVFLQRGRGFYRLSTLCNQFQDDLPMSYLSFKRLADRTKDSRATVGVFKYQSAYLIAMPEFGRWLRTRIAVDKAG